MATTAFAQNAAPKPPAPKLPAISDAQRAKFFKAQVAYQSAQTQVEHTQAAMQAAVKDMQTTCGDEAQLTLDQSGDPACAALPPKPAK